MDNDIVQGEDDRHTEDDEGETERLPVKKKTKKYPGSTVRYVRVLIVTSY